MNYNPFSLQGKTILVTGASSGIGKVTSIVCSKLGAKLILTGRNEQRLRETLESLEGEEHEYFVGDLTKKDYLRNLAESIPLLSGLVHSAGTVKTIPFGFISYDLLNITIETNFIAPVLLTQELMNKKKIGKGGSVVIISSISGIACALAGNGVYSASKGAITSIAKIMALEFAIRKIRVNTILAGMVRTKMAEDLTFSDEEIQEDMKKYPLGYGESSDVAFGAVYLLSDASKWITGTDLKMDGGYTLH